MKERLMKIDLKKCNGCQLHIHQEPLTDTSKEAEVMWVGISAKLKTSRNERPLDVSTISGELICNVESILSDVNFYRANLVKCSPITQGKLRYPMQTEMDCCFRHLQEEIQTVNPKIVFLLGKQVSDFILRQSNIKMSPLNSDYNYKIYFIGDLKYIPIHHPSYIAVYKKKERDKYITNLAHLIQKLGVESEKRSSCNF